MPHNERVKRYGLQGQGQLHAFTAQNISQRALVESLLNMTKPKLTVLTDPLPIGRDFLPEAARRIARVMKYTLKERSFASHSRFRGHFAVTRSLVEGLEKIGADFNYNPNQLTELADTVVVLAGVRTLRQAIRLKQQGKISRLFAGPNIVHFSTDFDSILASPEVDAVITPSDWVIDHYVTDNPSLKGRIFSWPAGVNTQYWTADQNAERNRILIFDKRRIEDDPESVRPYVDHLRDAGWQVDVLARCGEKGYTQEQYRALLQGSCLMLGFTVGSESQGIAWTEAWSCDVPTLIKRNTQQVLHGRHLKVSTAPYLGSQNGLFFDDFDHFKVQICYLQTHHEQFTPRAWTLANMSDEVCAKQLYSKVI